MISHREFKRDINRRRRAVSYLKRLNVETTEDNVCRLMQMEDEAREEMKWKILATTVHIVAPIIASILTALITIWSLG